MKRVAAFVGRERRNRVRRIHAALGVVLALGRPPEHVRAVRQSGIRVRVERIPHRRVGRRLDHRARRLVRLAARDGGLQRPLPRPSEFDDFIEKYYRNVNQGVLIDRWGFKYYLVAGPRDSVIIASSGPDARRETDDDVRVAVPRR